MKWHPQTKESKLFEEDIQLAAREEHKQREFTVLGLDSLRDAEKAELHFRKRIRQISAPLVLVRIGLEIIAYCPQCYDLDEIYAAIHRL